MVIQPAKTGRETNKRTAVTKTDQGNMGIRSNVIPRTRILVIVE